MGRLSEFARSLWIETQLGAPPFVRGTVIPQLHKAKEIARLAAKPYLALYQLQGQGPAGALAVTYGGLGYAQAMLNDMLFTQEPVEHEIGRVPLWRLSGAPELAAGDITIVEASKHLIQRLPSQGAIVLPWRIQLLTDTRGEWEDVLQRFRATVRKQELRLVRKHGYEYIISHNDRDFEMFYNEMYLPSVKARHGNLASVSPIGQVRRYFRHGWLFLIKQNDAHVAGCVCYVQSGVVKFSEVGVLHADNKLMQEGAQAAVYYAMMHWANQRGYEAVDFLGSWPFMSSGLFQYKRKWGASVGVPPREHKQIWIRIQRNTPAVSHFLKSNPCVIIGRDGKLYGLIVTDDSDQVTPEMETTWRKLYETPGLGLCVRSVTDLMKGA